MASSTSQPTSTCMLFPPPRTSRPSVVRAAAWLCCLCLGAAGAGYVNDFAAAEVGKPRADFAGAGGGAFAVVERDGNKVLDLPGEPLDIFGMLFGPQQP